MKNTNNIVFKALHIISWIIFIGLCIEAGGLIINFIFSVFKPEFVGNLYQKLDLQSLYEINKWAFFGMYSFVLTIAALKAYLFYIVINLMHNINLLKPFNSYVSNQITNISYYTFSIGLLSHIAKQTTNNLLHHGYDVNKLNHFWEDAQAFILMAAVIYIIAVIFKKGVDLQNENDLTV